MIKFLNGSKRAGLFRKEHMLSTVFTWTSAVGPEEDFVQFREGFIAWIQTHGSSATNLLLVFMVHDSGQQAIYTFFSRALGDMQVAGNLGKVRISLQFPLMSQSVAEQTQARILTRDF